jgi:hypothetical protein
MDLLTRIKNSGTMSPAVQNDLRAKIYETESLLFGDSTSNNNLLNKLLFRDYLEVNVMLLFKTEHDRLKKAVDTGVIDDYAGYTKDTPAIMKPTKVADIVELASGNSSTSLRISTFYTPQEEFCQSCRNCKRENQK